LYKNEESREQKNERVEGRGDGAKKKEENMNRSNSEVNGWLFTSIFTAAP